MQVEIMKQVQFRPMAHDSTPCVHTHARTLQHNISFVAVPTVHAVSLRVDSPPAVQTKIEGR